MIEIKNALKQAIQQLSANNQDSRLDAEVLLAYVLMKTRTYLYTHPEECLSSVQWITFQRLINKRRKGYPVAYLTGTKEFWSLPLKVSEDTLIPRPETELLVELTLSMLAGKSPAQILELGTGSGAIALAIAKERPDWTVIACDCSEAALQIAEENAASLGLTNIQFYCSDWYSNLTYPQFFDAIVSNPPYICQNDPHLKQGDLRFEPQSALVSGETGLTALQHIIQYGIARLKPMGLLLVEHGYDQKFSVGSMLNEYGYTEIQCWQDWQGNDRISGGKRIIVDEIIDF